jgi:hypothetical protein
MTETMMTRRLDALELQLTAHADRRIFWANDGEDLWHEMGRGAGSYTAQDLAALEAVNVEVVRLRVAYESRGHG